MTTDRRTVLQCIASAPMLEVVRGLVPPEVIERAFWEGLRPDPNQTVAEWAEENRVLSAEASGKPGRWRNLRTPYLIEIMESLSPSSRVEQITFMKSAQIGGTETGNNWIGYIVARGLGPTLAVQKSVGLAERYSKQRLDPLFRDTVCLRGKVAERRQRNSGNTLLLKSFSGGMLMLSGAEAAAGLRSMPIRNLFLDEIDAYPEDVEGEGDPCELAERRTMNFVRRKILRVSTPTDASTSRIERAFEDSDQRYYNVCCPECDHEQRLVWANLRYEQDESGKLIVDSVGYACAGCGTLLKEHQKQGMLEGGRWIPTAEEPTGLHRGYHISALYSPWFAWWRVAELWIKAQGNPQRLKTFVNTILGESWKEKGERPGWELLMNRREQYEPGTVPAGAVVLTAGVDVQRDRGERGGGRLEVEVVGWGPGHESWSIEYLVLEGDPAGTEVWSQLSTLFSKTWPHESGAQLRLSMVAIDSSDQTGLVYTRARGYPADRCMVLKGASDSTAELVSRPKWMDINFQGKKVRRGVRLWMVGVSMAKHELYAWLGLEQPVEGEPFPEGYCHFPEHADYGKDYFQGLTAEEWVREKNKRTGRWVSRWRKTFERNEPLDLRVYARAAAAVLGIDRWTPEDWKTVRDGWDLTSRGAAPSGPEESSRIRPAGYLDKYRKRR